jgi:hypothetical protein
MSKLLDKMRNEYWGLGWNKRDFLAKLEKNT